MSDITDKQVEQVLFKLKANKNSKELKRQGKKLELLELDPEVKALDEFIMQLKRGELLVDIPEEQNLEDFNSTKVMLPKLGKVMVYEPSKISEQRKIDSAKSEIEKNKIPSELEADNDKKSEVAKYSVISLKDENENPFDLVIDIDGNDVGKIIYNEKGKPSFEMAPELKEQIDGHLARANVRSFVEEQTLQEEFYLQDISALERAIKEGKVVPETVKETGERAIAANNIKNKNYTAIDADKALMLTPQEQTVEEQIQEEAKERAEAEFSTSRLQTPENERDIVQEQETENELEEAESSARNVQTQPKLTKSEPEEEKEVEKDDNENDTIPQEKKEEVEEICKKTGISLSSVKAVLIILDPKTLADCTENSHIKPNGNKVTVVQFSDVAGKEKYTMIQDGIELGGDAHDESFEHLIEPLHRTTGTVKRVEDEKSYVDYTDSTGELNVMKLKRVPEDMSIQDKERFKEKLAKDLAQLEMVRANDPENTELINQLELKVFKDFEEVGLIPPETIKQEAEEVKEEPENAEQKNDEKDGYDEIGRRTRPH